MLEKMKEMISEQLGCRPEEVVVDASFKDDLGADSLDLFELITIMEEEYDVEFEAEELEKLETVGDVIDFLKEKGVED
ncbi:MAG: acyl carrier protein [Eubacteriales bacterium]|nr:acyl carrier protein [Eubacteriales bacterium]